LEEELRTIYEAQKIHLKIMEHENKRYLTPERIKSMDNEIKELKNKLEKEKQVIDELEKERRKKEKEIDAEREKIKKYESKLYEVKTNKEYQALLKEIETAKSENDKTEEDILILMEKVEELKKDYGSLLKKTAQREKEVENEKNKLEKEIDTLDKQIDELTARRDELLSTVSENLRKTYRTLLEKRNGIAVVNVRNGVCLGCYMNIPPQMFIEATKNQSLIFCPSCNRIFYFTEE